MQVVDRPHVIVTRSERGSDPEVVTSVSAAASLGMWAAAGVLLLGSLVDLGILWGVQRQSTPQWEFVALLNTAEALPRFVMALAFIGGALFLRRTASLLGYRFIAAATLVLGVLGAGIAFLIVTDYFALSRVASAATEGALRGVALKGIALGLLYLVVLAPLGIIGLRWPKAR